MPNIKSQAKRLRQTKKRASKNKQIKLKIKAHISKLNKALVKKDEKAAQEMLGQLVKLLDKAASKGAIHKNKAANKKSSLMKKFNAFKSAPKEKTPKPQATKSQPAKSKTSSK